MESHPTVRPCELKLPDDHWLILEGAADTRARFVGDQIRFDTGADYLGIPQDLLQKQSDMCPRRTGWRSWLRRSEAFTLFNQREEQVTTAAGRIKTSVGFCWVSVTRPSANGNSVLWPSQGRLLLRTVVLPKKLGRIYLPLNAILSARLCVHTDVPRFAGVVIPPSRECFQRQWGGQ